MADAPGDSTAPSCCEALRCRPAPISYNLLEMLEMRKMLEYQTCQRSDHFRNASANTHTQMLH
jgi:hypothetical protein